MEAQASAEQARRQQAEAQLALQRHVLRQAIKAERDADILLKHQQDLNKVLNNRVGKSAAVVPPHTPPVCL